MHYQKGVDQVAGFRETWESLKSQIDPERYQHTLSLLNIQLKEAKWWRDACLSYFQSYAKLPLPEGVEKAPHDLDYYEKLNYPYAPGIRPRW